MENILSPNTVTAIRLGEAVKAAEGSTFNSIVEIKTAPPPNLTLPVATPEPTPAPELTDAQGFPRILPHGEFEN